MTQEPNSTGDLKSNELDAVVSAVKAAVSVVPILGGPIAEALTQTISNQRTDRIVRYVTTLESRISALEISHEQVLDDPERIDAVEEGAFQAGRATTVNRINQIVELVASGMTEEGAALIRRKRLLKLFGQLDDEEILILNAFGDSYGGGRAKAKDAWDKVNRPAPAHIGASTEVLEEDQLYELGVTRLVDLGLLSKNYGTLKQGQLPEFDRQKKDFKHRLEVSFLGRLLLSHINAAPSDTG